ncbi:MAG: I78 family peptidase inhibitor, partial [Rhodobacterales bacterium]
KPCRCSTSSYRAAAFRSRLQADQIAQRPTFMRYSAPITLAASLLLIACMPETPQVSSPPDHACSAASLQGLLGQPVAQQDLSGMGAAQRVMADGSPMTMDDRADRLNVTYNSQGRITRIWCG